MIPPLPHNNLDEYIEKIHIVNITSPICQWGIITVHRIFTFLWQTQQLSIGKTNFLIFLWAKCFLRCKLKIAICNSTGNCKLLFFWWESNISSCCIITAVQLQESSNTEYICHIVGWGAWKFMFPLEWQKLATFQTGQIELSHWASSKD